MDDVQISAADLKARLDQGEKLSLIDVREPWEFDYAHIPGSKLIPLGELQERFEDELSREVEHVMICHHGVRSMHALLFLRHHGYVKLRNLRGGIDAMSSVDPKLPRY